MPENGKFDIFDELTEKAVTMFLNGSEVHLRIPDADKVKELNDLAKKSSKEKDGDLLDMLFGEIMIATVSTEGLRGRTAKQWGPILRAAQEGGPDCEISNIVVRAATLCGFEGTARVLFKDDKELAEQVRVAAEEAAAAASAGDGGIDHIKETDQALTELPT